VVANCEFLHTANVRFLDSIKVPTNSFDSGNNMVINFQIRRLNDSNLYNRLHMLFGYGLMYPIQSIQERIQELARLVRKPSEESTISKFGEALYYSHIQKVALKLGKSIPDLIMKEIERLEDKSA